MSLNLTKGNDVYVELLNLAGQPVSGNAGNDLISGLVSNSFFLGGLGNDTLWGDILFLDVLNGGNDTLFGGQGNDFIYGGGGRDLIMGDAGSDVLNGGFGGDYFRFNLKDAVFDKGGVDTILDFRNGRGSDVVQLYNEASEDQVEFVNLGGGDAGIEYHGDLFVVVENTSVRQLENFTQFIDL